MNLSYETRRIYVFIHHNNNSKNVMFTRSSMPNLVKSIHEGNTLPAIFTSGSSYPHRNSFTDRLSIGFDSWKLTKELNAKLTNSGELLSIELNPYNNIKINIDLQYWTQSCLMYKLKFFCRLISTHLSKKQNKTKSIFSVDNERNASTIQST